jgi:hypothetical protein
MQPARCSILSKLCLECQKTSRSTTSKLSYLDVLAHYAHDCALPMQGESQFLQKICDVYTSSELKESLRADELMVSFHNVLESRDSRQARFNLQQ